MQTLTMIVAKAAVNAGDSCVVIFAAAMPRLTVSAWLAMNIAPPNARTDAGAIRAITPTFHPFNKYMGGPRPLPGAALDRYYYTWPSVCVCQARFPVAHTRLSTPSRSAHP